MKTLLEREWVKVVGHRDVPGKPAMYATSRTFLDYFNLKTLDELPTLAEIRDIDSINAELDLEIPGMPVESNEEQAEAEATEAEATEAEATEAEATEAEATEAEATEAEKQA
jgi:segregation and condensation protein B